MPDAIAQDQAIAAKLRSERLAMLRSRAKAGPAGRLDVGAAVAGAQRAGEHLKAGEFLGAIRTGVTTGSQVFTAWVKGAAWAKLLLLFAEPLTTLAAAVYLTVHMFGSALSDKFSKMSMIEIVGVVAIDFFGFSFCGWLAAYPNLGGRRFNRYPWLCP